MPFCGALFVLQTTEHNLCPFERVTEILSLNVLGLSPLFSYDSNPIDELHLPRLRDQ